MAKITEQMKEMVQGQPAFVATATPDGIPSVAPKGTTRILDEEHIIYSEGAGKRTFENIKMNPKVAIIIGDLSKLQCLRFSGTAEIITVVAFRSGRRRDEETGRVCTACCYQGQGGGDIRMRGTGIR